MPKLDEKKSIGELLEQFDKETPLASESGNAKRKAEGKPVRSEGSRPDKKQKSGDKPKRPCWGWQKGTCKFGDSCRFLHEGPGQGTAAAVCSSTSNGGAAVTAGVPEDEKAAEAAVAEQQQPMAVTENAADAAAATEAEAAASGAQRSAATSGELLHLPDLDLTLRAEPIMGGAVVWLSGGPGEWAKWGPGGVG